MKTCTMCQHSEANHADEDAAVHPVSGRFERTPRRCLIADCFCEDFTTEDFGCVECGRRGLEVDGTGTCRDCAKMIWDLLTSNDERDGASA